MGSWTCIPCNREFISQKARAAHFNDSPRHPHCEPCKRGFLDHQSRLQHMRSAAAHTGRYCSSCDRLFADEHAFRQHKRHAAVHRYVSEDSDEGSDVDTVYDEDSTSAHSSESHDFDAASFTFHTASLQSDEFTSTSWWYRPTTPSSLPTSAWMSASDNGSSSAGEDSSYLNASSDEEEEEESDSDDSDSLPEQSSDGDSDTSESPPSALTSDVYRSTITHTRSSTSNSSTSTSNLISQSPPSVSRVSFSTDTTVSSSATLTTETQPESSPANPDIAKSGLQGRKASGSGYTCPLCLELDGDPALELSSVKCGHVFCTPCITRALERKRQCPVCRARAKLKHVRRIFLSF